MHRFLSILEQCEIPKRWFCKFLGQNLIDCSSNIKPIAIIRDIYQLVYMYVCRCRKIGSVLFGHGMEATNSSNCQNQFLQRCAFKYQKFSSYIVWNLRRWNLEIFFIIVLFMIFINWISIYFSGVSLQNYLQLELALHLLMAKVHHKCATLWGVA